ncbi:hypothetical protein ABPG74_014089 [Tetrahymena malaccensis]
MFKIKRAILVEIQYKMLIQNNFQYSHYVFQSKILKQTILFAPLALQINKSVNHLFAIQLQCLAINIEQSKNMFINISVGEKAHYFKLININNLSINLLFIKLIKQKKINKLIKSHTHKNTYYLPTNQPQQILINIKAQTNIFTFTTFVFYLCLYYLNCLLFTFKINSLLITYLCIHLNLRQPLLVSSLFYLQNFQISGKTLFLFQMAALQKVLNYSEMRSLKQHLKISKNAFNQK